MTIESPAVTGRRTWGLVGLGVAAVGVLFAVVLSLQSPPQIGTDEGVFRTVDALYTAVRNRDEKQLSQCDTRLQAARSAGTLPAESAAYLDRIIVRARGGGWETAAQRLYDFMLAQRRDGFVPTPRPEKKSKSVESPGK